MAQTFTFEEASQPTPSPFDAALQAEGVTGTVADVARSIYQQESGSGKNTKTSNAGAVGGMQILPGTFKRMADKDWDINDPVHNARAGIRYIQQMNELAGGDPALTAAGYYGGPKGLEKAKKGVAVSDPRNPNAPNTLEYGQQVAARVPKGAVAQVMDKVTDAVMPSANAQGVQPTANSKAAPVTFSFEEAQLPTTGQGAHAAEPVASAPPKRSMVDELGRQLGLTVRAGVKGVASIPAMVSDAVTGPINAGLDKVAGEGKGFRFQPAAQAMEKMLSVAGLPEPGNARERVVQDAASAVVGAGSMVKGGLGLAKYASGPVAKSVGNTLAAGPGLQGLSAATGAGASGTVRENGGGAGAQIAAGLAGALAPGFAVPASAATLRGVMRGGEAGRRRVAENIATFERASGTVPTLGQATEGRAQRAAESLLSKFPGGAGVMVRKAEGQLDDMAASVQRLSDELAPGASAVNAGEAIAKGARTFKEGFKTTQNRLYSTLDKHIPEGTPIQVGNTEFALKELNSGIDGAPNISEFFKNAKIKGIDKALQADLELSATGGSLPYEAVKKLRTLIGNEIADNSLIADVPRSKWSALYGALSEDLGMAAKQAGPQAEQSWQWANQFTKTQLARLEELSTIVARDTPEKIFMGAISGTAEGDTIVKRVITMIPKAQRREVAAAVLQRMGRATNGQQNAMGDAFSSETFLTNLSKLSAPARRTLFGRTGNAELETQVLSMAKMADNIRQGSKVFANPSGTAQAVTLKEALVGAGAAAATGNLGAAAGVVGGIGGANLAARLVTNPNLVKKLAQSTSLPDGARASLAGAATRVNDVTAPAGPQTFSFEEAQVPEPAQPQAEPPPRIDLSGMAQPDSEQPVADPAQDPGAQNQPPVPEAFQSAAEIDPAHAFTSQPRPDGTLAIAGDTQALRSMLTAAGIPARSLVPTKDGLLVGRTQAGRVQEAIDRMNAAPADQGTAEAQGAMQGDGAGLALAEDASEVPVGLSPDPAPAPIDIAAHDAATSPQNDWLEPTPGQQQAGNYKLGHDRIAGMDISIENPQGSVRRGVDPDGKPWETQMQQHYGYFKRTTANDGDKLDVLVKPGTPRDFNGPVFVIDQVDPRTGKLDEHKTILGAKDEAEAKEIYRSNYAADWKGMGSITRLPLPVFKAWATSGDKKHPLGDLQGDQAEEPRAQAAASTDQPGQPELSQSPDPAQFAQQQKNAPVDRIQALRDAGENTVADLLHRDKTMGDVQTELTSMQAATPDPQHHASTTFSQHYQQRRLAGMKPAEASAHAGIVAAVQDIGPKIGLPEKAIKLLAEKLNDTPIDAAPGVVERFTQGLIKRGLVEPFEGSDQIASIITQARDQAMHGALDSLYRDNPATQSQESLVG